MSLFYSNHRQGVAANFLFSIQYKSVLTDLSELFILWLIFFQHFSGQICILILYLFHYQTRDRVCHRTNGLYL